MPSARRGCRCSIAASSTQSRTCAAGRSAGGAGTRPAGCGRKWNTFNDFIDVTDFLVARGYGARDRVFARGGSAGGLLVGVIANVAPQNYRGLIAHVPFVDIVTTMLDETIPLTTHEYEEWGDPHEREHYEYMLSYSPYDNVRAQAYPAMLVTTGLWDSQVQYYEPAKWVAKLRAAETAATNRCCCTSTGSWPRRQVRQVRAPARGRARIRLHHQPQR